MKPRVYVILRGGLGNQLHQISAGAAVSERVGGVVRIYSAIVDSAVNPTRRGYFRSFNLSEVFWPTDIKEVGRFEKFTLRIFVRVNFLGIRCRIVNEKIFDNFRQRLGLYLVVGWFQSQKFLPNHFNPLALSPVRKLDEQVTMHVRLTDFAQIDNSPLDSTYYQKAITNLQRFSNVNRIVCFSDDILGAQRILKEFPNKYFPELMSPLSPDKLLIRMSSTRFLICSRSSLSWWAGQIVTAKGGLVFSPWSKISGNGEWITVETHY